jgi:hypothetical protein
MADLTDLPVAKLSLWFRVRAVAHAFKDFTEMPPNTNRGQVVDRFVSFVGLDPKGGFAWCLASVYYCGYWGLFDPISAKSAWPLKKTAGCQDLADYAKAKKVLMDTPEEGDVFLVWYASKKRFAHTGFLISKNSDGSWNTIEGNTTKPGDDNPETAREGWGMFSKKRVLKPGDKFVRWMALV